MKIEFFMNFRNFCIDYFDDVFKFGKLAPIALDDTFYVSNRGSFIELWAVQSSLAVGFVEFCLILHFLSNFAADVVSASQRQLLILGFDIWTDLIVWKRALVLNSAGAACLDDRWLHGPAVLM